MNKVRLIYKYLIHFLSARNTSGFGVHSPFLFQFTRFVLAENKPYYIFRKIELLRNNLKRDQRV
ncbi:MAG: hypothetical protein WCJ61_12200, partial [Paludibacter sp.]